MSNLTDALIAAKLVGGSGGSGGGSGLPEITRTESTVLETQPISFTYGYADLSIDGLEVGTEYSVIYDGVTYSGLIAKKDDSDTIYIGNVAIWGATPDTDEPFIISTYQGGTTIGVNDTNPTHEVGISATVYTPANGSVLMVDGGEWKAVAPSGGEEEEESDIFIIHVEIDGESGMAISFESFDQCESAWNAGKVLFFDFPLGRSDDYARYYLVHDVRFGSQGITRFDATDVQIVGGTLVYSEIQYNRDGEINYYSNRYTLTPAN